MHPGDTEISAVGLTTSRTKHGEKKQNSTCVSVYLCFHILQQLKHKNADRQVETDELIILVCGGIDAKAPREGSVSCSKAWLDSTV